MKKIKVYLQHPWKFQDSSYYKYLFKSPPKNIEYINKKGKIGIIQSKIQFQLFNWLKRIIKKTFNLLKLSIPNAHY